MKYKIHKRKNVTLNIFLNRFFSLSASQEKIYISDFSNYQIATSYEKIKKEQLQDEKNLNKFLFHPH